MDDIKEAFTLQGPSSKGVQTELAMGGLKSEEQQKEVRYYSKGKWEELESI